MRHVASFTADGLGNVQALRQMVFVEVVVCGRLSGNDGLFPLCRREGRRPRWDKTPLRTYLSAGIAFWPPFVREAPLFRLPIRESRQNQKTDRKEPLSFVCWRRLGRCRFKSRDVFLCYKITVKMFFSSLPARKKAVWNVFSLVFSDTFLILSTSSQRRLSPGILNVLSR